MSSSTEEIPLPFRPIDEGTKRADRRHDAVSNAQVRLLGSLMVFLISLALQRGLAHPPGWLTFITWSSLIAFIAELWRLVRMNMD